MRIAMTGGRSFLGEALLERLVEDGHEVVVIGSHLGISEGIGRRVTDRGATFVSVDAEHGCDEVRRALRGEARLVLFGYLSIGDALSQELVAHVADDVAVNRFALRAVRGIAAHIVYASSTSVYGLPERVPIAETDRTVPLDPRAQAMLRSERVLGRMARAFGTTATILRFATVYGPGEASAGLVRSFARSAIEGTPPEIDGDGLDEDDYVYVDDAVEVMLRAIAQRADSTYNVGTGIGTTSLTLARAVTHLLGLDIEPVFRLPRKKQRARIICSTARVENELGFTAWPYLHHGIQNEIAWLRGNVEHLNEISIDLAQSGSG
jgi:UDP-glucose 4-epimerase